MGFGLESIQEKMINTLTKGNYFGEISMLTEMKRTATVRAREYCTLACISKEDFTKTYEEFPQIYLNFKGRIKEYTDPDFNYRRQMLKTIPYFRNLDDDTLQELIYLMRQSKYDPNTLIIKRGDVTDNIYMLKEGVVEIEVPFQGENIHFDFLPPGSCFCTFSAFNEEMKQILNFKAKTICIVETIKTDDLINLSKTMIQLKDVIKELEVEIKTDSKTDFDFFRFKKDKKRDFTELKKQKIRSKFRYALSKFINKYKEGLIE
ncbi:MAG: cyclic nucleotide-binding domain-containing protein [Candidatus Roizmanbacteria bacterium]